MMDFKKTANPIASAVKNVVVVTKEEIEKKMVVDQAKAKKVATAGLDYLDKQINQAKNEVKSL